jgi:hypothetical protein
MKNLFILLIFLPFGLFAQSDFKKFKKLSRPEKCWVLSHPFKAKTSLRITKIVLSDVDSIKKTEILGEDLNGGKLDAFKHAYWMASLTFSIGKKKSLRLGKAHEKGNWQEFKKHRLEDSILPDSVSSTMDLHNNSAGAGSVTRCENISKDIIQKRIIDLLKEGKLLIIKKDNQGNYLYCDGTFIDTNKWKGKWDIPKCLVGSDN